MKKDILSIDDFSVVIPWEQIREVFRYKLGKRAGNVKYRQFCRWMNGQTVVEGGVFPEDLDRFLRNLPVID